MVLLKYNIIYIIKKCNRYGNNIKKNRSCKVRNNDAKFTIGKERKSYM